MATSLIPKVIDAVYSTAKAHLPDTNVYDGFGVTVEPGLDYLMVGVDDPDGQRSASAAEATQDWAHANSTTRDENGVVTCAAVSWNGDGDAKAARDHAFATVAAVETAVRADPTLGVAGVLYAHVTGPIELSQDQTQTGAVAYVLFRITYRARI